MVVCSVSTTSAGCVWTTGSVTTHPLEDTSSECLLGHVRGSVAMVTAHRCNRYDAQKKAASLLEKRRDSYYGNARELEAVSRFLHYYERYKEHLNSLAVREHITHPHLSPLTPPHPHSWRSRSLIKLVTRCSSWLAPCLASREGT